MKRVKKGLEFTLIWTIFVLIFSLNANADNNSCGANVTWKIDNGTLTILGSGPMYDYKSSGNSMDGYTINSPYDSQKENVTKIVIDNGVTYVGNYAFQGFTEVKNVSIANTVESIGDFSFYGLRNLVELQLPNSVKSLGNSSFAGCIALDSLILSNSLKNVGNGAFFNSCNLHNLIIPYGVELIGDGMFSASIWTGNVTVSIPGSVTKIGEDAFKSCSAIYEVNMPDSVKEIGEGAFHGCIHLTKIHIPENLSELQDRVFEGSGLEEISFPKGIKKIGSRVFSHTGGYMGSDHSAIKSVTFEGTSVEISENAFENVGEMEPATLIVPSGWTGTLPKSETEKWYGGYFKVEKKADSVVSAAPTAKSLTYNGQAQELVTAGKAEGGTMQYALGSDSATVPTDGWSISIPTTSDAGTYYVWYKVVGDDNHADTTAASIVVTVSKANSSVTTAPTAKSLTYNEKAQELVTAGSANGGVFEYALGTGKEVTEPYTSSIPKGTDAGTYYVWCFVAGDKNHNDTTPVCITVMIGKPGTEKPVEPTPATATRDAFTGVTETIRISAKGTAVVKSVEDNGRNTLKVTGTVNQNGTTYVVSRFASNSFSDVDAKNIVIDLVTSGNEQRVTIMPKAFNGSGTEKLKLKLTSASQVKFKSGAFSGSSIKKIMIYGLDKTGFKKVQKNLKASGYKEKIVKR